MATEEKCTTCDRPPITHRWKAGVKNWVCGNGHNWTSEESNKKEDVKTQEQIKKAYGIFGGAFKP